MGRKRTTKSLDGLKRVYWMRNQWQYKSSNDERQTGLKAWEPLGSQDAEARLKYAEIKNSIGSTGGMSMLFDKFLVDIVAHKKAERTRKDDQRYVEKLRPVFGHMDPRLIMPRHIQAYVDLRAQSSIKQSRQEYSVLNQLFTRCKVWIDMPINPCDGVALPKKPKSRSRLPQPWEIAEVRKYAKPQFKLYIDFKFATGLDQGVIRNLLVRDILNPNIADFLLNGSQVNITKDHFREEGIKVMRSKTQVKGIIQWTPDLQNTVLEIFKLRKEDNRNGETLFCSQRHTAWSKDTFNNGWQEAKKTAMDKGKLEENFTEHDMRAAHLEAAEKLGFDGTTQLLHSDSRTTKIYRRSKEVKSIYPVNLSISQKD